MLTDAEKLWQVWGQAGSLYDFWAASKNINYYLLFVLYALDGQEIMTQKKICTFTGLTKQTVNNVIRSLKKEGYVILSPGSGDKREKQVSLTEKGESYSRKLLDPLQELEHRVLQIMGNDRVQQMVDSIALYNTILEKEMTRKLEEDRNYTLMTECRNSPDI